jgi:hypothetical protein
MAYFADLDAARIIPLNRVKAIRATVFLILSEPDLGA